MYIIREFSEFEYQRLTNVDGGNASSTYVKDPHLSYNEPFRAIDLGKEALLRFNAVMNKIMGDNALYNKNIGQLRDIENISDLIVQRVTNKDGVNIDIFISFKYHDTNYFGVIRNFNTYKPKFNSELYNTQVFTIEQKIKIEGILIKALTKFFMMDKGFYITLKPFEVFNTKTGNILVLPNIAKIEILSASEDMILIDYNGTNYKVSGINYYYLNYFLTKLED